jgi:2-amino-4-hydroxy-6-hydroxymethyldihydropteridine diphosphokinase
LLCSSLTWIATVARWYHNVAIASEAIENLKMILIYLALGSNIGDRKAYLEQALGLLTKHTNILKKSAIFHTAPQYEINQPEFLNQVIEAETLLSPADLLKEIKHIEQTIGREAYYRYGPRTIDIDILYYGRHIIQEPSLIIPHPNISERKFVLEPLCEIAPAFLCPASQKTVSQMLEKLVTIQVSC